MRVVFSRFIETDLNEIARYIAQDSIVHAARMINQIQLKFKTIASNPFLYRLHSDVQPDGRLAYVGKYVILFRVLEDSISIDRVLHGARDLPNFLEQN